MPASVSCRYSGGAAEARGRRRAGEKRGGPRAPCQCRGSDGALLPDHVLCLCARSASGAGAPAPELMCPSAAPARGTAGVALHTGTVAHVRVVAAFATTAIKELLLGVRFVAFSVRSGMYLAEPLLGLFARTMDLKTPFEPILLLPIENLPAQLHIARIPQRSLPPPLPRSEGCLPVPRDCQKPESSL